MKLPWVYTCCPSWTPPPSSLPIPSLWVIPVHQPQASSIMHRTWTGGSRITADGDWSHNMERHLLLGRKKHGKPRQCIKKQKHYFANKGPYSKSYGFSSSHVWMWELDQKERWALKNWCLWIVVLEKTLESPLHCKEIKPVHPKGDQPWSSDTLATWCEEQTHWKRPWCWERLKAGGEGDNRGWDGWMASLTQWAWVLSKLWELVDMEPWHAAVHGVTKSRTRLSDWTELNCWVV